MARLNFDRLGKIATAVCIILLSSGYATAQEASPKGPTLPDTARNCSGWHFLVPGDASLSIEQKYNITSAQFLEWNPSVSSDFAKNFWAGFSYCVQVGAPGPVKVGVTDRCNTWHTVVPGDTCASLQAKYGISEASFYEWNPAVSKDCASEFWTGFSYCVGIKAEVAQTSSVPSSSSTSPSKTTSSSKPTKS